MRYTAQVYVNVREDGDHFFYGYGPGDPVGTG